MSRHLVDGPRPAVVMPQPVAIAVPACDEAGSIEVCLRALDVAAATAAGAPVTVVVLVNNTSDATAAIARAYRPFALRLVVDEVRLPPERSHAGGARRTALDRAAGLIASDGVLMTTDADSRVDAHWIAANLVELAAGADAVAGVVAFDAVARAALPPLPLRALEWRLAGLHARLGTLLDPRAHDPWPNHIWAWGASLALTIAAYRAVGGLPEVPLAEDRALVERLERFDLRVRRSHAPVVFTSTRCIGRAPGGFADLLTSYVNDPHALCDAALEPTATLVKRLNRRARLRAESGGRGFGERWAQFEATNAALARRRLVPGDLAAEVALADALVNRLEARRGDTPAAALAA